MTISKRPELPEQPLPCPFCGSEPRVNWNGGMTIKCINPECCNAKTAWWIDVEKCIAQWNRRMPNAALTSAAQKEETLGIPQDKASVSRDVVMQPLLAQKHKGMKVSASGILLRVRGGLRFGAEEMNKHLNEMADRYYSGDIAAVDEFCQLYCLDKKRPVA